MLGCEAARVSHMTEGHPGYEAGAGDEDVEEAVGALFGEWMENLGRRLGKTA